MTSSKDPTWADVMQLLIEAQNPQHPNDLRKKLVLDALAALCILESH